VPGVIIKGHHDWFNVFQRWEDFVIDEVIADPGVVTAVRDIRAAQSPQDRARAVGQLVERIG
jgi:hypothetical protein